MHPVSQARVDLVHNYLKKNGPLQVANVEEAAQLIGIPGAYLIRVLSIVRSPEFIAQEGWTVPFVTKGPGIKTYSVEKTVGDTDRLRDGNNVKTQEVETHLRRNLAGLKLEARLATPGTPEADKARILATVVDAALTLIDNVV